MTIISSNDALGLDLHSACKMLEGKDLFGTTSKITPNDCVQVDKAVAATEMMKHPPVAKAPEAPVWDAGTTMKDALFWDEMENTSSGFWNRAHGSTTPNAPPTAPTPSTPRIR